MSKKNAIEAKKYLKDGEEALKTSLFKWNKDYVTAASCFEEAAKLFRQAKEYDVATKVYEKCVVVNDKLNDNWGVAKNYEAILTMAVDRTDGVNPSPEPLVKWAAKAGIYFRLSKAHHAYIKLVKKVVKYLDDQGHLVEAMNLYKHLLNDLEDDDEHYIRSETITNYAALLVKVRRYPECITLFEREYTLKRNQMATKGGRQNLDTIALTIIALYLIIGDVDKAEKKLQDYAIEIRDFVKSPEFDVSEKMVEAYADGKQADFNKNAQRGIIDNIYPYNIIKELRDVKVKASTDNRRIINLDDDTTGMNETSSVSRGQVRSDYSSAIGGVSNGVVNEEQRQRALDDFLC